jgi:hypothetical protein
MKATGSTIPLRDFQYSRYRYITWDAEEKTDEEGNSIVEFNYAEAERDCSDEQMRAAILVELAKTGEENRIDEIMNIDNEGCDIDG